MLPLWRAFFDWLLFDLTYGYGDRPLRFLRSLSIILFFVPIYFLCVFLPGKADIHCYDKTTDDPDEKPNFKSIKERSRGE